MPYVKIMYKYNKMHKEEHKFVHKDASIWYKNQPIVGQYVTSNLHHPTKEFQEEKDACYVHMTIYEKNIILESCKYEVKGIA